MCFFLPSLHLVKADEGGHAHILFPEEVYTLHGSVHSVHYDVVQCTTGCADGYIILLINGT